MDDFRFILVAWLIMFLMDDKKLTSKVEKAMTALYFTGFVALFIACFAVPALKEAFIWYALYPLIAQVVRFAVTKIADSVRGLFKRELIVEDDDAPL